MKIFPALFIFCSLWFASIAENSPTWLRYSAISPDGNSIVFTYKGDLWLVPTQGGEAVPITFHEAHDFMPVWSNDSKTIAFSSDRFEIIFDSLVLRFRDQRLKPFSYLAK